jgi:hypothetical protein
MLILIIQAPLPQRAQLAYLLRLEGHDVREADACPEAIKRCEEEAFHVIMADMNLFSGDDVASLLVWRLKTSCGLCTIALSSPNDNTPHQHDLTGRANAAGFDSAICGVPSREAVQRALNALPPRTREPTRLPKPFSTQPLSSGLSAPGESRTAESRPGESRHHAASTVQAR